MKKITSLPLPVKSVLDLRRGLVNGPEQESSTQNSKLGVHVYEIPEKCLVCESSWRWTFCYWEGRHLSGWVKITPGKCILRDTRLNGKWSKCSFQHWVILSLACKCVHMMPKHALIGFQMWHDRLSNIWSLTDRGANFCPKISAHKMAERLDIEDFFREIDPDLCQYTYTFHKSGFTSTGLEIIFWLVPVKLSSQIYFCSDKKRFWPEICITS